MYSILFKTYSRYLFTIQDLQNTFKSYGVGYEKIEYEKILEYIWKKIFLNIYGKKILEYSLYEKKFLNIYEKTFLNIYEKILEYI